MKRCKACYLDYFVDGNVLIPAVLLTFEQMAGLLDAAYDGKISFVTKRRKGA
jgi:hypothetical protein